MDAAAFAAMSDPDRNPQFRRRWEDPATIQQDVVLIPLPQDTVSDIGYALLEACRRQDTARRRGASRARGPAGAPSGNGA